ncbi:MAG: uL15 family ribosomal protein [Candidatus Aenigmarchaeota archaeon]|nr:uL15 family ribosomal protein [Candidatus Aenigmarchaeota archaeon]
MKKCTKMRGSKTHGYGSKKKHRGAGSRGGRGFAGSFKHKKVRLKKFQPEHFKKRKFKSLRRKGIKPTLQTINLRDLTGKEADLPGFKILAAGQPPKGIIVKATAFSERAKEKIEKSGGKAEKV